MKAEVEAERSAAEAATSEEESSEEESALPEGTVVDPQTGETVQMPDPDSVDQSDDSVLGDAPVNENLENVEPADAAEDTADANPTE